MEVPEKIKKAWHWFWHDDSFLALIVNIVVAFIVIKYILYPVIGLILGTPLPVVAVVSGSMEHTPDVGLLCGQQVPPDADYWETCGAWYEERGITEEVFATFPFSNGFNKGDIMILIGLNPDTVEVGDVPVFHAEKNYPIIHRITAIHEQGDARYYETKGDHNVGQIQEYVLTDGRFMYRCYKTVLTGIVPSACGIGANPVTADTPGALTVLDESNVPEDIIIGKAVARIPWLGYAKIWFVDLLTFIGLGNLAQSF